MALDAETSSLERSCRASLLALRVGLRALRLAPDAALGGRIVRRLAADAEILGSGILRLHGRLLDLGPMANSALTETPDYAPALDIDAVCQRLAQMRLLAEEAAETCPTCGGFRLT